MAADQHSGSSTSSRLSYRASRNGLLSPEIPLTLALCSSILTLGLVLWLRLVWGTGTIGTRKATTLHGGSVELTPVVQVGGRRAGGGDELVIEHEHAWKIEEWGTEAWFVCDKDECRARVHFDLACHEAAVNGFYDGPVSKTADRLWRFWLLHKRMPYART